MNALDREETRKRTVWSYCDWLYTVSGLAALSLGVVFLLATISLIAVSLGRGSESGWLSPFQDNWLVVLFKLNAGLEAVEFEQLRALNPLDIGIMLLVAVLFLGLYVVLRQVARAWTMIAALMPFLGIVLFVITHIAGRSAVMGAVLIISFVMLRSSIFNKGTAFFGILAGMLLLAGDFGTTENSQQLVIAGLIGLGYVLLMAWFFLTGIRLLRLRTEGLDPEWQ